MERKGARIQIRQDTFCAADSRFHRRPIHLRVFYFLQPPDNARQHQSYDRCRHRFVGQFPRMGPACWHYGRDQSHRSGRNILLVYNFKVCQFAFSTSRSSSSPAWKKLKKTNLFLLTLPLIVPAAVAGYFPVRRAARLDPVRTLRNE